MSENHSICKLLFRRELGYLRKNDYNNLYKLASIVADRELILRHKIEVRF